MRRLMLLVAAGTLWLFLLAVPVFADNGPHIGGAGLTPGSCAQCHRAHSAAAANLLVRSMPDLCYTCHGTTGSGANTSVQNGLLYTGLARAGVATNYALRGGGIDSAAILTSTYSGGPLAFPVSTWNIGTTGTTPSATTSHHSVDGSAVTMWGNGPESASVRYGGVPPASGETQVDLTCGSCHDPHGNNQFRILKPAPDGSGIGAYSYQGALYTAGGRVYINDASPYQYYTLNYGVIDPNLTSPTNGGGVLTSGSAVGDGWNGGPGDGSDVAYNTATHNWYGTWTSLNSRWCQTCHTRYFGPSGSAEGAGTDATYKFRHAEYNIVDPNNGGTGAGSAAWAVSANNSWISASNPGGAPFGAYTAVTGTLGTNGLTTTHAPKCLTCHLGHGSPATMGGAVIAPNGPGTSQFSPGVNWSGNTQVQGTDVNGLKNVQLTAASGSTLLRVDNRGVCQACHNK